MWDPKTYPNINIENAANGATFTIHFYKYFLLYITYKILVTFQFHCHEENKLSEVVQLITGTCIQYILAKVVI